MKKIICIMSVVLAACAAQPRVDQAYVNAMNYGRESDLQAEAGLITWEARYTRLFELSGGIQSPTVRQGYQAAYNEMIPVARKFDAKQISANDFSDARRNNWMRLEATTDAYRREGAAAQERQNAEVQKMLQNTQQQQNLIYQQQMQQLEQRRNERKQQTNCTSNIYGNTVQTNCW